MQDLRAILPDATLKALRAGYSQAAMLAADLAAVERVAPELMVWNRAIGSTFYESSTMKPIDRERCLIALITTSGPAISLGMHIYWGLMEGLTVDEIVSTIALAGCYGGLPRAMFGIETAHRVLRTLAAIDTHAGAESSIVVRALLTELAHV